MSASQFQPGGGSGGRRGRRGSSGGGSSGSQGPRDPYASGQNQNNGPQEQPQDIALRTLRQVLAESEKRGDKADILTSHTSLAVALLEAGRPEEALEHCHRSLELAEELQDTLAMATTYLRIGQCQSDLKQHTSAIASYKRALTIFKELGDSPGIASVYTYDAAIAQFQQAISLYRQVNDQVAIALTHSNLGAARYHQGQYEIALEEHRAALTIWQRLNNAGGLATTYNYLAAIYNAQGRYDLAMLNYGLASAALTRRVGE
jgi:tetratricopeptide (TPR) repeat protein